MVAWSYTDVSKRGKDYHLENNPELAPLFG
jgi:hypothetical protein